MKHPRIARAATAALAAAALLPAVLASPTAAVSDAASCAQVRALDAAAADGEHEITVFDKTVTVWCADMATTPVEYLSLPRTGGSHNFSQDTYTVQVTTHYTRVRLRLPATASDSFSIVTTDDRFATSNGSPQRTWGSTGSCFNIMNNSANLDLTGTPFGMSTSNLVYSGSGNVSAAPGGQVIDITGAGGWCGGIYAASAFPLTWLASAPVVATHPAGQVAASGDDATFSASATGSPTPTVQWEWAADGSVSWAPIAGATSTTLVIPDVTTGLSGVVRAVFSNAQGSASTGPAVLDVTPIAPTVSDPADATATSGGDATFSVTVAGDPTPTVTWASSTDGTTWDAIADANDLTLVLAGVTTDDDGLLVRASASSAAGSDISDAAQLLVDPSAPTVTDPTDTTVTSGDDAAFSVAVTGDPEPTVQWQVSADGVTYVDIADATGTELVLADVTTAVDGTTYRAAVSNAGGTVTSGPALLGVAGLGPQVVVHPTSATVAEGDDATFAVTATGDPTPTFRWQTSYDGLLWSDVASATGATFTLPDVLASMSGLRVRVVATSEAGSVTSETAVLTVTAAPAVATPAGALPSTGSEPGPLLALGGALIACGTASLLVTRRRRA